jgi:tripartite-type tricarboxylate transporter receptor subunit TctC
LAGCGTAAFLGGVLQARAQTSRVIRLVVPFTPGGSTDILARAIAPKLGAAFGTQVVVDNKPGAGGSLGAAEVARAEPDGHTLLMGHIGTLAVNPALYPRLPYDPVRSFTPVAWVARVPNLLVVPASLPVRTLAEFLGLARSRPGRLTYSSGGNGSAAHIAFESLKLHTGIFMLHIPYRGTVPSVTDLLAGQVDATFTGAPAVLPHVRSGRLRALAVSSPQRLPMLPEVPTVAETVPKYEATIWLGFMAPKGTPTDIVTKLNAEMRKIVNNPEVKTAWAKQGAVPLSMTVAEFEQYLNADIAKWANIVKVSGAKAD